MATPGRLLDLMEQGFISLNDVGYFVLDEADRTGYGFIRDIKNHCQATQSRQSLFFQLPCLKILWICRIKFS